VRLPPGPRGAGDDKAPYLHGIPNRKRTMVSPVWIFAALPRGIAALTTGSL
jgi:hypothetical protein